MLKFREYLAKENKYWDFFKFYKLELLLKQISVEKRVGLQIINLQ